MFKLTCLALLPKFLDFMLSSLKPCKENQVLYDPGAAFIVLATVLSVLSSNNVLHCFKSRE